jgi:putative oxidoreductase
MTVHTRRHDNGWALVPLRLAVGFGFAAHGWAKLSRGPASFGAILAALGVPFPHTMAWVTSVVELAGGIAVMSGVFVPVVAGPLIVVMLTAMFSVHLRYGFSSVRLLGVTNAGASFGPIGYEMNILYIAGLTTLILGGAGRGSIDRWLANR